MKYFFRQKASEWIHLISGFTIIILSVWTIYLGRETTWQEAALYAAGTIFCFNRLLIVRKAEEKEYIGVKHGIFWAIASIFLFALCLFCIQTSDW